ncbi:MAG TPA: DNA polymerase III subunit delta' [Actinomycetota bacterium]|nr:DNA polymerase III subunit delta' [Actinomycetota bacterium]
MTVWDPLPQTRAIEAVERQLAAGEVAHAWLLLGPAGSGKRPTAVAMSAALNCPEQPGTGCGECSVCLRVQRRRFPDVHHIVPEGPIIAVDVVRETIAPEAARSPFEGRTKVFIIEEAERMNAAAQNALLKTLEEPQPDTVFILISDDEDEVLETIRSRCRIVRLDAIPEARIVELLSRQGVAAEAALVAARVAEGDLEYALELVGEGSAGQRRRVWLGLPRRLTSPGAAMDAAGEVLAEAKAAVGELESVHKLEVQELAEILERRGSAAARNALAKRHKRELRRREEQVLGEALDTLAAFYRDIVVLRRGGAEAITNIDVVSEIERWAAGSVPDASLVAAIERCVQTRAALLRNANPALQMEAVLVEVSRLVPAESTVGVGR